MGLPITLAMRNDHRLISDDVVYVRRLGNRIEGLCSRLTQYMMEIRGLGIIDIRELYGARAIRERKTIELVIHFELWDGA